MKRKLPASSATCALGNPSQQFTSIKKNPSTAALRVLSARQSAIITMAGQGLADKEIADALACSVHTIAAHWRILRARIGARNKAHAVALLMQSLRAGHR